MLNRKRLAPLYMNEGGGEGGAGGAGGGGAGAGGDGGAGGGGEPTSPFSEGFAQKAAGMGFTEVSHLENAYSNLEQHMSKVHGGKDMSQVLYMPNADKPEEVSAFYQKLGAPEKADGYEGVKVAEGKSVTEGADSWFRELAHKNNLTTKQAESIWNEWSDFSTKEINQIHAQNEERDALGKQNLQKSWGADYQHNLDRAAAAANALGISAEDVDGIQAVIGFEKTMQAFDKFARAISDPSLLDGGDGKGEFVTGEAGYQAQIDQLKGDQDFVKSLTDTTHINHRANKEKWENLHKLAYPGEQKFGFG